MMKIVRVIVTLYEVRVVEQEWMDGRRSRHRSKEDILEFARNQNPVPTRCGKHKEIQVADPVSAKKILDSGLGMWI